MRGLTVHNDSLRHVVCIVACDNVTHAQHRRSTIQRLPSENPTDGTIPLLPDLLHDLVHSPPIQLSVANNTQLHPILFRIPLHGLKRVIAVTFNPLVDGQEHKLDAIAIALIKRLQHCGEDSRILPSRRADSNLLAPVEELIRHDCLVSFDLEDGDEAGDAEARVGLYALDLCTFDVAVCA